MTCPVSPRVARKEYSQLYPIRRNKSHTNDFSRLVGTKMHLLTKASGGALISRTRGQYSGNPRRKYLHSATDFLLAEPYPTNYNNHPIRAEYL